MGLENHLWKFAEHYFDIAALLNALTRGHQVCYYVKAQEKTFEVFKQKL
jgi:hypothetical protein